MGWAIRICPRLVPPEAGIEALDVIRHEVGFRPHREGGPRIEKEVMDDAHLGALKVVHSYGASGFGYQSSYGMANTVVTLVQEFLNPA